MGFIPFTFADVIDILLVASLFYGLYRAMKGTSAPYIMVGIFFIYLVWILVKTFNLVLFSTILGQIISVGVIAIIIIFQPEIRHFLQAIGRQETIAPTAALIHDLKTAGYKLYVLSNMSREFIDFLRGKDVYSYFDGDVVSCEVEVVKPMPHIYDILLERFELDPSQTLFIDDRKENVEAAEAKGISTFHFDRNDYEGSCVKLREMLL